MKKEMMNMFKKLTKVYDDSYIVRGIARNCSAFKTKNKQGRSLAQILEAMDEKGYASLATVVRALFVEDNKDARPFVIRGNFAIKFDDVVKYLLEILNKKR